MIEYGINIFHFADEKMTIRTCFKPTSYLWVPLSVYSGSDVAVPSVNFEALCLARLDGLHCI